MSTRNVGVLDPTYEPAILNSKYSIASSCVMLSNNIKHSMHLTESYNTEYSLNLTESPTIATSNSLGRNRTSMPPLSQKSTICDLLYIICSLFQIS